MGGFLLAFAIKIPLFPFHTWQPNTYVVSPMAGTMLLSALMLKMALYGMIRWMIPLAPEAIYEWKFPVIVLGLIGVIYAAILAIKQNDLKRLFAYASISHVGLIAAGIMLFTVDSTIAVFVQIFNHSLVAVGLFLSADIFERRLNTRDLNDLGGIAAVAPKFAFWFAIVAFASMSVPFTSGFIGEFLLIKGLYNYHWFTGCIAGLTLVFGAVYMLRAYQKSMYGAKSTVSFPDLSWNELLVFLLLALMIVFLGLYPQLISDFVKPSLEKLIEVLPENQNLVH
jgi:NADH-quinone oxidoreductase subunit M